MGLLIQVLKKGVDCEVHTASALKRSIVFLPIRRVHTKMTNVMRLLATVLREGSRPRLSLGAQNPLSS